MSGIVISACNMTHCHISDPNVSNEAQQNARQVLRNAGESESTRRGGRASDNVSNTEDLEQRGNVGNVVGGYKATLKSKYKLYLSILRLHI